MALRQLIFAQYKRINQQLQPCGHTSQLDVSKWCQSTNQPNLYTLDNVDITTSGVPQGTTSGILCSTLLLLIHMKTYLMTHLDI